MTSIFLEDVQAWIDEYADGQLSGRFSRDIIRGTDYCNKGRYSWSISCAQNKKGMAAKAALIKRFFGTDKHRLDKTPEEEKAIVLAAIEAGKAQAQKKEGKTLMYKDPVTGWLYRVSPNPINDKGLYELEYLDQQNSTIWKPDVYWNTNAVYRDQEHLQEALDDRARRDGWELVEDVPAENPTDAAEDVQQCASTASNAPLSQSQSVNADAQQGGGDDSGKPVFTVGKTIPAGTEARRRVKGYAAMRCGEVSVIHVCRQKPESVKIWLNSMMPSEYWVMSKSGDVCGEHVEICPYCEADLKNGEGDVLIVPFGHSENFTPAAPASPVDAGAAARSPSAVEPASLAADECTENPTSSAAATDAAEETAATPEPLDLASMTAAPVAKTSAATTGADENILVGSGGLTAFDFSALGDLAEQAAEADEQFNLHYGRAQDEYLVSCIYLARIHELTAKAGRYGGGTWTAWYQSKGISEGSARTMVQNGDGFKSASVADLKNLPVLTKKDLNLIARNGVANQVVEAAGEGDSDRIQDILNQLKAVQTERDEARKAKEKAEQERDAARDAQANLSAMANKFSKQRDAAEQRVEDAERRAQAAEEDAAGWKQAGLEMQELVDQRDERIRELESGITVEAAAVDQEEIERRANELSEPLLKIINQRDEQIKQMASGNTVAAQASVLEQYLETMKASLLGNARRAELACYDVGALDSLAQALRAFADEIDGLFEEGEENEE